ncbi:dihydrofolate reductase family protein [Photobacterium galatheae]|uniref:Dihydrofolate reductase n=1 Tax=Photobacterium galatheae TaxID=1654360 RepID=A0A066RL09_9GAMM|nr:dihydrofolate reductase family protein [Photobacterium galatheae]KDM89786.1 dihydrofolate reductase [Photobacterium galatheae]MCM0151437.1 dihydrofolate reductase family protein [Photobacterium galatheae]
MKCSVFIAISADGYIATPDGGVEWLHTAGNPNADLGDNQDMGFNDFINNVDCMIMGRKCMEVINAMHLSPEQWPYGDLPIIVLSQTLKTPPAHCHSPVEIYAGDIQTLLTRLTRQGYTHAYVDGGQTITSFLNLGFIQEITVTQAPVLLGEGIPLFGSLDRPVKLEQITATAFANDFIQIKYCVNNA